jgi:hypothetical protein
VFLTSLSFGMLVFGLRLIARALGASALAIGGLFAAYALIVVTALPIYRRRDDHAERPETKFFQILSYSVSHQ